MFVRNRIWQDAIILSQTQTGWENIIVLNYLCVDIRFRLKGYGWKANPGDTELVVVNAGRYECYYREKGTAQWIHFCSTVSERASVLDGKIYKDTFATLGVVSSKIYEVKIIASDAEKFKEWGGALEGIAEGQKFWHDLKIRADKPFKISVSEDIPIIEYSYGGRTLIEISHYENIKILDIIIPHLIHLVNRYETLTVNEYRNIHDLIIELDAFENFSVMDIPVLNDLVVELGVVADDGFITEMVNFAYQLEEFGVLDSAVIEEILMLEVV